MSAYSSPANEGRSQPVWICLMLGLVLVGFGILVLGDVVLFTVVSAFFIGVCAIAAGLFELVHAFWTKGWGGFVWQIILGLLYLAAGLIFVTQPVAGALALTWLIGLLLVASGIVRIIVGARTWSDGGWLLLVAGVFGIIAGAIVFSGWPDKGLWLIGLLLGIDLILHGVGWLLYALQPAGRAARYGA